MEYEFTVVADMECSTPHGINDGDTAELRVRALAEAGCAQRLTASMTGTRSGGVGVGDAGAVLNASRHQ